MILDSHPDQKNLNLKAIGYWKVNVDPNIAAFLGAAKEDYLPNPRDHVGTWHDDRDKQCIVDYVKSAPVIIHWRGWSTCRFGCPAVSGGLYAKGLDLGSTCLSDGTYVWPEGFHHYIDVHNVIPAREFCLHVLSKPKDWLVKNSAQIKEEFGDGF